VIDGIFSTLSSSTFLTSQHFSLFSKSATGLTDQALLIHCPAKNFLTTRYILLLHSALEYKPGQRLCSFRLSCCCHCCHRSWCSYCC